MTVYRKSYLLLFSTISKIKETFFFLTNQFFNHLKSVFCCCCCCCCFKSNKISFHKKYYLSKNLTEILKNMIQTAVAAEYTDCISAEGLNSPKESPGYDTKQSDGEATVMLELWGMLCTSLFPSLPGPLWSSVVVSDRALSTAKIEVNLC